MEMRQHLYTLSLAALFVSLSIILTRYASIMPLPSIRIGFGSLPIQVAGIFLGPLAGAAVGLIADPLGYILNPIGTYHLGFTLSSVLNGFIPGLLVLYMKRYLRKQQKGLSKHSFLWVSLATTFILTIVCSALLNTLWLSQLLGSDYTVLLVGRLPAVMLTAVVHFALLLIVLPALERAGAGRLLRLSPGKQR